MLPRVTSFVLLSSRRAAWISVSVSSCADFLNFSECEEEFCFSRLQEKFLFVFVPRPSFLLVHTGCSFLRRLAEIPRRSRLPRRRWRRGTFSLLRRACPRVSPFLHGEHDFFDENFSGTECFPRSRRNNASHNVMAVLLQRHLSW